MQAVLNRPIVADYIPAVKPPWVLVALAIGILAIGLPRELLPEVLLTSAAVIVVGSLVNWLSRRLLPARDEVQDTPADADDWADGTPCDERSCRAA